MSKEVARKDDTLRMASGLAMSGLGRGTQPGLFHELIEPCLREILAAPATASVRGGLWIWF